MQAGYMCIYIGIKKKNMVSYSNCHRQLAFLKRSIHMAVSWKEFKNMITPVSYSNIDPPPLKQKHTYLVNLTWIYPNLNLID